MSLRKKNSPRKKRGGVAPAPSGIPSGKPFRIGNFKIWRTAASLGKGRNSDVVEQICISDLDGGWQVRIPATFEMYHLISGMYAERTVGDSAAVADAEESLHMLVRTMYYATIIGNGYFHEAIELLCVAYANPSILTKKDGKHKEFLRAAKALVAAFLAWRAEYDKRMQELAPTESDMDNEEVLSEILDKVQHEE